MSATPSTPFSPVRRAVLCVFGALMATAAFGAPAWDAERLQAQAARSAAARSLPPLIAAAAAELDDLARLQAVNEFYNRRIVFRDDLEVWGEADYWASPLETLAKGAGDCEDYAIAKYFTLLAAGVTAARMRLVYVRAQLGGPQGVAQPHMVLAYYAQPAAEPLILDNLIGDVRSASRRPDLTPVFSFNSEGLWQGADGAPFGDPLSRLSRWRGVLQKARAEGLL